MGHDSGDRGGILDFEVGLDPKAHEAPDLRSPFRIAVIAALAPHAEYRVSRSVPRFYPVARGALDEFVASIDLEMVLPVEDPLPGSKSFARPRFRPRRLRDLSARGLRGIVPELEGLRRTAEWLERHEAATPAEVKAAIQELLGYPDWTEVLCRLLREGNPPDSRGPADATGTAGEHDGAVDRLFAAVDVPGGSRAASSPRPPKDSSWIGVIAKAERSAERAPKTGNRALGALVWEAYARLLESLVRHPELQRLEAVWSGLRGLLAQGNPQANIEVVVCPAADDEVEGALALLQEEPVPPSLAVAVAELRATAHDLDRASRWAEQARQALCPLLVSGGLDLLGAASWHEIATSRKRWSDATDPRATLLRALSAREESRWLAIALNRPVATAARTIEVPAGVPPLTPTPVLWGSPALAVATIVAQAVARDGHPFRHLGPRWGTLSDGAVAPTSGGEEAALEALPSLDVQEEVARCGLTLLGGVPNRDSLVLSHAPMLYRGPGATRGADPVPEGTLADQILVAQVARVLHQLAASVPADTDPSVVVEVTRIALRQTLGIDVKAEIRAPAGSGHLHVTVRPPRDLPFRLGEVSLSARLGG